MLLGGFWNSVGRGVLQGLSTRDSTKHVNISLTALAGQSSQGRTGTRPRHKGDKMASLLCDRHHELQTALREVADILRKCCAKFAEIVDIFQKFGSTAPAKAAEILRKFCGKQRPVLPRGSSHHGKDGKRQQQHNNDNYGGNDD